MKTEAEPRTGAIERGSLRGVRIAGRGEDLYDIEIRGGSFASIREARLSREAGRVTASRPGPRAGTVAGAGLAAVPGPVAGGSDREAGRPWIGPGLVDLHTHLAWTDFHHADGLGRSREETERMIEAALEATLRSGVTTARDAGGLSPALALRLAERYGCPLRVIAPGEALGASDAAAPAGIEERVARAIAGGSSWIKVFATGGLGSPPERVLDPVFSRDDFFRVARAARLLGAKVFVHTYGGPTLDWAIEAGVDSVEHGVYMSDDQAARLAEAGVGFVPTVSIYRLLADPAGPLDPGAVFRERAARVADAHGRAVAAARRAGALIGLGTDFSTPALHGLNLAELYALVDCGLSVGEAWHAATEAGASILGLGGELGGVREGRLADFVMYSGDPLRAASAERLAALTVEVRVGGKGRGDGEADGHAGLRVVPLR